MSLIPMTDYDTASDEVKREYEDQIAKHGRITNMKRTMLNDPPTFRIFMEWYDMYARLAEFLPRRAIDLFSYAISSGNDCLICSTFFRKIIKDSGDDPDDPKLSATEKLLMDLGRAVAKAPHDIPDRIYRELGETFDDRQLTLIVGFACQMCATNLCTTVVRVPVDDVLYEYRK